jgi:hypothetical protein
MESVLQHPNFFKNKKIMNLYKILLTHAAPKDYKTAIKEYLVAEDDKTLFEYLKKSDYTYWEDCERDEDEYDGMFKIDFIFEHKGDSEIETNWQDLYYGSSMYDWELVKENIKQVEIDTLVNLGVAKVV